MIFNLIDYYSYVFLGLRSADVRPRRWNLQPQVCTKQVLEITQIELEKVQELTRQEFEQVQEIRT